MKKKFALLFLIFIFLYSPKLVYAAQTSDSTEVTQEAVMERQLNAFDFERVDAVINKRNPITNSVGLKELTLKTIKGELDISLSSVANYLFEVFFSEFLVHKGLIQKLIAISILSAVLNNLTSSFKNKSVGELGFYVSYIVLVTVLFTSFQVAVSIMTELISTLATIMEASLPLMLGLLAMSGSVSGVTVFNPILVFTINFITSFIKNIFTPILIMASAIEIVNYLTGRELLTKLTVLIKSTASWTIKGVAFVFLSILSLQKISAPIMNNLVVNTAKASSRAVPVIGGLLGGAVDTVLYFASAAKSGVLVALIIVIIGACLIPVLEMLALLVIYKLCAAIMQPICDKRIVDCIDSVGAFTALVLGCGVIVIVMFIFSIMIMLSF